MHPTRSTSNPHAVDNTDWLKTAAIIAVSVGHFGHFFVEDDRWWSVFGRLAAPTFFFFIGYAQSRTVPPYWIWLGFILTLLEQLERRLDLGGPEHSFELHTDPHCTSLCPSPCAKFRLGRLRAPRLRTFRGAADSSAQIVDYGAEGWLWALFGLYHRMYVNGRLATNLDSAVQSSVLPAHSMAKNVGLMRLPACFVAAVVYVWQEQKEFSFSHNQLAVVLLGVGILSTCLCLFLRGPSRIQPPKAIAGAFRFIGRHTLEIYAIQLAGSELLIKLAPSLAH